jgi:PEP-CTERM motif
MKIIRRNRLMTLAKSLNTFLMIGSRVPQRRLCTRQGLKFMKTYLVAVAGTLCALGMAAPVAATPSFWESNFGTTVLTGDDNVTNRPFNGVFPLFGSNYVNFNLSTNGFVQFAGQNGSGCCNGNANLLLTGFPRIATLWSDLNPTNVQQNDLTPGRTVITWQTGEFGRGGSFTSQLTLLSDGRFVMGWDGPSVIVGHDTLTGVSPGGGATDPLGSDFSTFTSPVATGTTAYQLFGANSFDLNQRNLFFTPTATGFSVSATGFGAVPEPATWAMMLVGFGLVGAGMRRRRQKVRVTYA